MGKVNSDLEKMNKDRRKAEEAYLESMDRKVEVERIRREGISSVEDLVVYIADVIEGVKHSEDMARASNNSIVYSEAIGIRREMGKLFVLVMKDGTAEDKIEAADGTEEAHRKENDGTEAYA